MRIKKGVYTIILFLFIGVIFSQTIAIETYTNDIDKNDTEFNTIGYDKNFEQKDILRDNDENKQMNNQKDTLLVYPWINVTKEVSPTELHPCEPATIFINITAEGQPIPSPICLMLVIDRSGSMNNIFCDNLIFSDGFETDFSKWDENGITDWDRTTDYYNSGNYSAHCGVDDTYLTSDNIDTSGPDDFQVTFWYRINNIGGSDNVYVQYWDGSNYDNIDEIGDDTEDTWLFYSDTISNSDYKRSDFHIRFEGSGIDSGEDLWVDDVNITQDCQSVISAVIQAANSFVDNMNASVDKVGLVSYSSTASLDQELTNNFTLVKDEINALSASGYTNIGEGIRLAQMELAANCSEDAIPIMLVFTDGVPNRHSPSEVVCDTCPEVENDCTLYVKNQATLAKNANTTIFSIGFLKESHLLVLKVQL